MEVCGVLRKVWAVESDTEITDMRVLKGPLDVSFTSTVRWLDVQVSLLDQELSYHLKSRVVQRGGWDKYRVRSALGHGREL